jgi:hypothetical protein
MEIVSVRKTDDQLIKVRFIFENRNFEAGIIATEDTTYIDKCYWLLDIARIVEIDIPTYFGTGFSGGVYTMLFGSLEKLNKEE